MPNVTTRLFPKLGCSLAGDQSVAADPAVRDLAPSVVLEAYVGFTMAVDST